MFLSDGFGVQGGLLVGILAADLCDFRQGRGQAAEGESVLRIDQSVSRLANSLDLAELANLFSVRYQERLFHFLGFLIRCISKPTTTYWE